jgi:hypothetical protein
MADGSKKPIEDVTVGDKVLATDPETGVREAKTVDQVFVHDDTVVDLVVDGQVITTTEDHPFWSVTDQRFERADELAAGEKVLAADGRVLTVTGLRPSTARHGVAHNLSIQGIHTYHVSDNEILVHNTCDIGDAPGAAPALDELAAAGKRVDKNGFTRAGFEQQKHVTRSGNAGQWNTPAGVRNPNAWNGLGQDTVEDILTNPRTAVQSYSNKAGDNVFDFLLPNRGLQFRQVGGSGPWTLYSFRN